MIRFLIDVYIFILIADVILSYIPDLRGNQVVQVVHKVADASCKPIRKHLPPDLPVDFSPLIVIVVLRAFVALF